MLLSLKDRARAEDERAGVVVEEESIVRGNIPSVLKVDIKGMIDT